MAPLQVQARALGDPTRHEIFRYIADAGRAVDVAELTAHLELNHNAIRQHLAKLVEAGLVIETSAAPTGRGRPRLQYALNPSTESRWGVTGPYERLSMLLTEILRTGDSPVEVGRRAGQRLRMGEDRPAETVETFVELMTTQGFEPLARVTEDHVDVTLRACPFASAVLTDADVVCALHLGMAEGMAEAVGAIVVDELAPKDPRKAHCVLRCRLPVEEPS